MTDQCEYTEVTYLPTCSGVEVARPIASTRWSPDEGRVGRIQRREATVGKPELCARLILME